MKYSKLTLRAAFSAIALLFAMAATAADDATLKSYYSKAEGQKAAALKTALYQCINKHTNIGYDGLLDAYKTTDKRADGYLRDWYSNTTKYVIRGPKENKNYSKEGDSYNREHLVPQSWFGGGDMKSDLVQVVPSDGYVNNRRSNYPFGENNGEKYMSNGGYCKLGACKTSGYGGTVFEPNDDIKGDIARVYFYVMACYENLHPDWSGDVFDGKKYPGMKKWSLDMMLRWSRQDPVDAVEAARNEAVWQIQKNRNPFVDYPDLCEYVWGTKTAEAFHLDGDHGNNVDPDTPTDPDNPENPENPDNPDNPGGEESSATSGAIDLASLTWTATSDPTYGSGFMATANGMTLAYYTNQSQNPVITVGNEMRLYKGSVFVISGGRVKGVTFNGVSSYTSPLTIFDQKYSFSGQILTWTSEHSVDPFIAFSLDKQVRITSIDVRISDTPTAISIGTEQKGNNRAVFDVSGKYIGATLPRKKGIYLVREGGRTVKRCVR